VSGSDPLRFVGTTIAGKYRVDRVLGEGGFGIVYAGEHLALGERIALKCIKLGPLVGEKRAADVFLREARVLFSLTHPAIVRMYDVGTVQTPAGDVPYVVLELVDGVSLEQEIARRRSAGEAPFSAQELLGIFESVLDGMSFAHQRGIAHRDLKPSNVMLVRGANGALAAKLLDFGTARVGSKLTTIGATSATGFTPRYAAPEQWDTQLGTTGPASDVFSLGLILAECCTLAPALGGGTPSDILREVMNPNRTIPVASRRPDLSPAIEHVIARATRVAPPERFASIREMLDGLRDALARPPAPMPAPHLAPSPAPLPTPAPMPAPYFAQAPAVSPARVAPAGSGAPVAIVVGAVAAALIALIVGVFVLRTFVLGAARDPSGPPIVASNADPTGDPPPAASAAPAGHHRIKTGTITPGPDIDRRTLKGLVEARFPDVDACYTAALDENDKLRGTTILSIRVGVDGATEETFCEQESTLKDQDFCDCLATSASTWHFPPTPAGSRFTYAIDLAP